MCCAMRYLVCGSEPFGNGSGYGSAKLNQISENVEISDVPGRRNVPIVMGLSMRVLLELDSLGP